MSELPKWAMEKANDIHLSKIGMSYRENVEAIAAALAEERERCAKWHDDNAAALFQNMTADTSYGRGELMMQEAEFHSASAAAIRGGSHE